MFRWRRSPALLLLGLAAHGGALVAIQLSQTPFRAVLLGVLALLGLLVIRAWRGSAGAIMRDTSGQWRWAFANEPEERAVPVRIAGVLRWPLVLIVYVLVKRSNGKQVRRVLAIAADAVAGEDLRRLSGLLHRDGARSGARG